MRKTHWPIAVRTPISATRSARTPNSSSSCAGRPNSFTSVAPGAENRSVIWVVMAALWAAASRSRCAKRAPMRRAGMTNTGSRIRASAVIDHDSRSITARVSTRAMRLLTTPDRVQVNARWAPITSLLSRLTRAPVRVRVKNATGICWTWPNTARRRSRMSPSPIRADCQRSTTPTAASRTAITAISTARTITVDWAPPIDDHVDDPAGEHRCGHGEDGRDDAQGEERDQRPPVRAGEGADSADRRSTEGAPRLLAPASRSPAPSSGRNPSASRQDHI